MPIVTSTHLELNLDSQNASYCNDPRGETIRALEQVIQQIKEGMQAGDLRDTNGNNSGSYDFTIETAETIDEWALDNLEQVRAAYLASGEHPDNFPEDDAEGLGAIASNIESLYLAAIESGAQV